MERSYSFHMLRQLAEPEKAAVIVHLDDHPEESPEEISEHLERPLSSVYRYLADLEAARLVDAREEGGVRRYRSVPFHLVLEPKTLGDLLRTPVDLPSLYRASLGRHGWGRAQEATELARKGKITARQAAARSGLPYREFMTLYASLGRLVGKTAPPPRG